MAKYEGIATIIAAILMVLLAIGLVTLASMFSMKYISIKGRLYVENLLLFQHKK